MDAVGVSVAISRHPRPWTLSSWP